AGPGRHVDRLGRGAAPSRGRRPGSVLAAVAVERDRVLVAQLDRPGDGRDRQAPVMVLVGVAALVAVDVGIEVEGVAVAVGDGVGHGDLVAATAAATTTTATTATATAHDLVAGRRDRGAGVSVVP